LKTEFFEISKAAYAGSLGGHSGPVSLLNFVLPNYGLKDIIKTKVLPLYKCTLLPKTLKRGYLPEAAATAKTIPRGKKVV